MFTSPHLCWFRNSRGTGWRLKRQNGISCNIPQWWNQITLRCNVSTAGMKGKGPLAETLVHKIGGHAHKNESSRNKLQREESSLRSR
jgi:hypothetical protein